MNGLTCFGISSRSLLAKGNREGPKTGDVDLTAVLQSTYDVVKDPIDNLFCFLLGKLCLGHNRIDQVRLCHFSPLYHPVTATRRVFVSYNSTMVLVSIVLAHV